MRNFQLRKHVSSLVLVIGLFAFRSSLADQYVIPSGSMEPTILVGDHVLVDKRAYDFKLPFLDYSLVATGEPSRGDVIVFEDPRDPSINLIKRVIGLPGDRVRVSDGRVEINGIPLETSMTQERLEKFRRETSAPLIYTEAGAGMPRHLVQRLPGRRPYGDQDFVIPSGEYFFLGDNRDNSADSREWGFASRRALKGRALTVLYRVRWKDGLWPSVSLRDVAL